MNAKTTALIIPAINQVELREILVPELQPDEVRIRTLHTLLSIGTEIAIASGQRPENAKFPYVPGYQGVGVIEAQGAEVKDFHEGDIVSFLGGRVLEPNHAVFGGHQGMIVTDTSYIFRIPEKTDPRVACLATLLSVGHHGVELANVKAGELVVVLGHGLIGAGSAQAARARGALVLVSEPDAQRRGLAAKYAADWVVDPLAEDLEAVVRKHLGPGKKGADVVIESTGNGKLIDGAFKLIGQQGRFVFQGWYSGNINYYYMTPHAREVTAVYPTGFGGNYMKETAVRLLTQGVFHAEPYLSHPVKLADAPEAYKLASRLAATRSSGWSLIGNSEEIHASSSAHFSVKAGGQISGPSRPKPMAGSGQNGNLRHMQRNRFEPAPRASALFHRLPGHSWTRGGGPHRFSW